MEDARQQAEELLEQERQHIRQEAEAEKELARADGYRQGYGEGLRQARVEGAAQIEEHRKQEAERIRSFLEQAAAARDSLLEQAQNELCELSLAVAEKVIHISLRTSRDVIARMIQVATEKLKRREWVHIYVGGYEARDLAQITPELTTALAGLSEHIKIIPMSDDELGACIIEMPDEIHRRQCVHAAEQYPGRSQRRLTAGTAERAQIPCLKTRSSRSERRRPSAIPEKLKILWACLSRHREAGRRWATSVRFTTENPVDRSWRR